MNNTMFGQQERFRRYAPRNLKGPSGLQYEIRRIKEKIWKRRVAEATVKPGGWVHYTAPAPTHVLSVNSGSRGSRV